MNELVHKELQQIRDAAEQVRTVVHQYDDRLETQTEQREKALQDLWRARKELAALKRINQDYETLQTDAERHQKERVDLRQRLRRTLEALKALRAQVRT